MNEEQKKESRLLAKSKLFLIDKWLRNCSNIEPEYKLKIIASILNIEGNGIK